MILPTRFKDHPETHSSNANSSGICSVLSSSEDRRPFELSYLEDSLSRYSIDSNTENDVIAEPTPEAQPRVSRTRSKADLTRATHLLHAFLLPNLRHGKLSALCRTNTPIYERVSIPGADRLLSLTRRLVSGFTVVSDTSGPVARVSIKSSLVPSKKI